MKKYLLSIFTLCLAATMVAQEAEQKPSPWDFSGVVGLNASATGLVNWAAGGNNNVNGVAFGKVRLVYNESNLSWETSLNLEYGISYIDQKNDAFQKSSDVIDFNTKLGWQFHKAWYLTASAGFKSQFAFGRAYDGTEAADPIISKFLSPSYTDISVGIDWKPNSIFSLYLSPVAGKITTAYVGDALEETYNIVQHSDKIISSVSEEEKQRRNAERERMRGLLYDAFGINKIIEQKLTHLSSGELRKFHLTRSLLSNPRLIIIDNPFIGLDVVARNQFVKLFEILIKEIGIQVMLVLSRPSEIPSFVTHVVEISEKIVGKKNDFQ